MKFLRIALTFMLVLCVSVVASAQTAEEIMARAVEVSGGEAALRSIQTMVSRGIVTIPAQQLEGTFVSRAMRPNMVRIEATVMEMTVVQATDGSATWMINPFLGTTDPMPMDEFTGAMFLREADIDGPYLDTAAKGIAAEYVGIEEIGGEELQCVRFTYSDGFEILHYFDIPTGLPRKVRLTLPAEMQAQEVTTTLSDYRQVGSILAAHRIEQGVGGITTLVIQLEELEINAEVDPAIFSMPEVEEAVEEEPAPEEPEPGV